MTSVAFSVTAWWNWSIVTAGLILECAVSVYDGYVEFFFDIWVLEIANIILFDVASTDLGLSHLMNLGYNNFMVTTDGVFVARPVESVSIWC